MKAKRVLVCAPLMPEFDREGGSRRIFHFLEFFQRDGSQVHFVAGHPKGGERYARMLQQKGIPTFALRHSGSDEKDALVNFERLIAAGHFDLVVFVFWYMAEAYASVVRAISPNTVVVVDTVDIEFLRQSRRVFLNDERNGRRSTLDHTYANHVVRELNVYGAADAVLTVSQKEADLVADFIGRPAAFSIPLAEDSSVSTVPFEDRNGMFFLGNFRHPPNVQAVEYLCDSILPRLSPAIRSRHPVYVVGNEVNQTVLDACRRSEHVRLVGWVPSVLPYLQQARVSLVPLLYGAGTKTKLIHSLMVGTPTVSTSIGTEGLNLEPDVHVLVADNAAAFASSIERLISNEGLWHRLSEQGRNFISAVHGREAVFSRFSAVFGEILRQSTRS